MTLGTFDTPEVTFDPSLAPDLSAEGGSESFMTVETALAVIQDIAWFLPEVAPGVGAVITVVRAYVQHEKSNEKGPSEVLFEAISGLEKEKSLDGLRARLATFEAFEKTQGALLIDSDKAYEFGIQEFVRQAKKLLGPDYRSIPDLINQLLKDRDIAPDDGKDAPAFTSRYHLYVAFSKLALLLLLETTSLRYYLLLIQFEVALLRDGKAKGSEASGGPEHHLNEMQVVHDMTDSRLDKIGARLLKRRKAMVGTEIRHEWSVAVRRDPTGWGEQGIFENPAYRFNPFVGKLYQQPGGSSIMNLNRWCTYFLVDERKKHLYQSHWPSESWTHGAWSFTDAGTGIVHCVLNDHLDGKWDFVADGPLSSRTVSRKEACQQVRTDLLAVIDDSFSREVTDQITAYRKRWEILMAACRKAISSP